MSTQTGFSQVLGLVCSMAVLSGSAAVANEPSQLQTAIDMVEANDWDRAIPILQDLLATGNLSNLDRSQARKYLGLGYGFQEEEDDAVAVFKNLVRDDPNFAMKDLAMSYQDEPDDYAVRFFAQATLEWRQDRLRLRKERLERTSRGGAVMRSIALPGLGQRYQGHRGRSWAMMGLASASVVYAILADQSYRDAKDKYDGADFPVLWDDYKNKADTADLALGIVAAVWALNLLDAAVTGPNLSGLESVAVAPTPSPGGVQVAWRMEF